MANVALLWDKPSDRGTLSGGSWAGGLPLANLQSSDVQRLARSTDATVASTKFRVDLGASQPEAVSGFALLNHNGTTAAQWRIVVTSDAADADAGQRLLDTGFVNMWVPTVVPGSLPWGTFPWDGVAPRVYPGGTIAIYFAPAAVIARYVWVYISDTANPAGYFQAGRFMAGAAWSPQTNISYGAGIRYIDPSEVRRTRGGRRVVNARPRYRLFEMKFGHLTKDEAFGIGFEADRQLGKSGDFLIVTDPDEPGNFRYRRTIHASLEDTSVIESPFYNRWQWAITAGENN